MLLVFLHLSFSCSNMVFTLKADQIFKIQKKSSGNLKTGQLPVS